MAVRTYLSRILVLAFLYFLFGWAVARLGQNTGFALIVFPSAGLALGACLYYGPRLWPGVWIGSFAYYLFFLKDAILLPELSLLSWVLAATGMAFAATAQALLGYFLFHRFNRPGNPFYQVKEVLSFIVLVGMLVGTVSASVNLPVLIWSGFLAGEQLAHEWVTWWLGDLLGVLIVTPVFLVWRQPKSLEWNPSRRVEACMLFLLFVVASQVVFGEWLAYSHYPLVYLLFPCLVWAAYRFGHYGAMGAILLVSLAAVWGTAQGRGPFVLRSPQESMALLQIYLLVLTVMTMILTAAATQAEEAQTQAVRFGRILDESSDEIYLFDVKTLKFLQVNRGAQANLGYSLQEMLSLTPLDIKPDYTREQFEALLAPLRLGTKNLVTFVTRHQRRDGSFYPVEARVQLSHAEIYPVFVAIIMDVTEKKKAEEELSGYRHQLEKLVEKRTADLETAHRQLLHAEKLSATGKMAASMAHEFNNPIYGIRNILEKIKRRVKLEPGINRFVDLAIGECDRVSQLIRKILDFHSPTSEEMNWVDIHEAMNDMILLVHKKYQERNISLTRNFSGEIPKIELVADQFKQVILNLLQNAEEAIPGRGGRVTISTSIWNGKVQIEIRDTGVGIPTEQMKNIFDPFFTTKPAVKGTGLGLSVTYGIIKKHGGEIIVDSLPGSGTAFTLFLPIRQEIPITEMA